MSLSLVFMFQKSHLLLIALILPHVGLPAEAPNRKPEPLRYPRYDLSTDALTPLDRILVANAVGTNSAAGEMTKEVIIGLRERNCANLLAFSRGLGRSAGRLAGNSFFVGNYKGNPNLDPQEKAIDRVRHFYTHLDKADALPKSSNEFMDEFLEALSVVGTEIVYIRGTRASEGTKMIREKIQSVPDEGEVDIMKFVGAGHYEEFERTGESYLNAKELEIERPEHQPAGDVYVNLRSFAGFYMKTRVLEGAHHIPETGSPDGPVVLGRSVIVKGTFRGIRKDNKSAVEVEFYDLWVMDPENGRFVFRQSWTHPDGV